MASISWQRKLLLVSLGMCGASYFGCIVGTLVLPTLLGRGIAFAQIVQAGNPTNLAWLWCPCMVFASLPAIFVAAMARISVYDRPYAPIVVFCATVFVISIVISFNVVSMSQTGFFVGPMF